ncbi:hypothetical protein ACLOJK_041572 [Asimina triloba]
MRRSRSSTGGSSTPNPLSARSLFVQAQTAEEEAATSAPPKPLTRRLILLRHAESSWRSPTLRDHDRPLSKTGRADAAKVSRKLQQMGWVPELILSSDAVRTKETLQIMQENARGFLEAEVYFIASFYSIAAMDGQTAEHLEQTISEYARDEILTVMCMGHNRGWEEAASMLSGATIELKTCNAALLESAGNSWNEFILESRVRMNKTLFAGEKTNKMAEVSKTGGAAKEGGRGTVSSIPGFNINRLTEGWLLEL